jgi:predicted membrane-bound mannosyltransferase
LTVLLLPCKDDTALLAKAALLATVDFAEVVFLDATALLLLVAFFTEEAALVLAATFAAGLLAAAAALRLATTEEARELAALVATDFAAFVA